MTLEAIHTLLRSDLDKVNASIAGSLQSGNALMDAVIEGYLKGKGKQIRPMLVLLSAKMLGEVTDSTISAAAAVEMLHNASLIHDDVVDDSPTRHGQPTINRVWDNHIAVLVGDFFVSTALARAIDTANIGIINTLAGLGRMLSLGEIDQIYNARYHKLDEEAYMNIIARKTASLFVACVEMGALSTGVTDGRLDAIRRYAELLGLCFQIKDDIFDYYSDDAIGKPTGNDLREGKMTLPLLYALTRGDLAERDAMAELARKDELDDADITSLTDYAKRAGGIEYAEATMRRMRDEAVAVLETIDDRNGMRPTLTALMDFIIERDR